MEIYVNCEPKDENVNLEQLLVEFEQSHPGSRVKLRYLSYSNRNPNLNYMGEIIIIDGVDPTVCDNDLSKQVTWKFKDPDNGNLTFEEV